MAFGNKLFDYAGGAVNDLFSARATSDSLKLKATGNRVEADNYELAASLAGLNKQFSEESTLVKSTMAQRQSFLGIGQLKSDIAGAGFANTGTAIDLLRSSASQAALEKALIERQGSITEAGYEQQIESYTKLAEYSRYAADVQDSMAGRATQAGTIGAVLKGASAIASLFI